MSRNLLTAMVIISIAMLTLGCFWFFKFKPELDRVTNSNIAYAIEYKIDEYHKAIGSYPTGDEVEILHQLRGNNPKNAHIIKGDQGFLIDGNHLVDTWGNPLTITIDPSAELPARVVSSGKNGIAGDDDDIDSSAAREILKQRGETAQ
ncbi:type II secretion system protein GspG [Sulfuriroseicoccus oceanibius]|uniref:Type II secretion system protein GspG n=1 Tax=Sulfuriroseicoccus oceanibius TaxID=2707525 RepID=A0A6B3LAG1_9BACT|nr:type II secretion system protein GspG [Sulfuriroseicoccus oceanibius]QQL43962.1 type II secretion system protein GspG [Sulfuriroseicoccus oceanibius]